MFCSKCGMQIATNGRFCPACGQPVTTAAATPTQPIGPPSTPASAPAQPIGPPSTPASAPAQPVAPPPAPAPAPAQPANAAPPRAHTDPPFAPSSQQPAGWPEQVQRSPTYASNYHDPVATKAQTTRKGWVVPALVAASIVLVITFFIGIAIGIPAYQNYTVREKVSEGLNLAAAAKLGVAESYISKDAWPDTNETIGYSSPTTDVVQSINIRPLSGTTAIDITYRSPVEIAGKVLTLLASSNDSVVKWTCSAPGIKSQYLPDTCRAAEGETANTTVDMNQAAADNSKTETTYTKDTTSELPVESPSNNDFPATNNSVAPVEAAETAMEEAMEQAKSEAAAAAAAAHEEARQAKAEASAARAEALALRNEAEQVRINEQKAQELAAQQQLQCPYSRSQPLSCASHKSQPAYCEWNFQACGNPQLAKKESKKTCDGKMATDTANNQIIVIQGCRGLFVPQQ